MANSARGKLFLLRKFTSPLDYILTFLTCIFQVLSLVRKGELSLRAYKHKVQEGYRGQEYLLAKNEAKILKLEGDMFDKSKKLEKEDNYAFKQGQRISHF